MAVDSEHAEYQNYREQWQRLRDCAAGQQRIHEQGTKYLPRLSDQTDNEYKAYKARASFYGATGRTIEGLSGMVFRKEPQVVTPEGMKEWLKDVTLSGLDFMGFAEQIVDDDITVGRCGIMVDHPVTASGMTQAVAEALNIRPFLKHYTAENVFNWRTELRGNATVLTEVRLYETIEIDGEKEFDRSTIRIIRVLDLKGGDDANVYRQRVFVKNENKEWIQDGEDIIPLMKGAPLDRIPFFFVGVKNGDPSVEKPPLIDLANVNLSHYMTTADLEHGAHFTGLPTAVVLGHVDSDPEQPASFRIGSATAWVFPNPETNVKYLEFEGQGLEALEKRLATKENHMAMLGARMLTPEKKAAEAAETAAIHRTGEISVLSSLAQSAGQSIEQALAFMAEWGGMSGDVSVKLNNDFMAVSMDSQKLTALLAAWQSGAIAFADLLSQLKRGEIVDEDRTEDEIRSEVETSNPFEGDENDGLLPEI